MQAGRLDKRLEHWVKQASRNAQGEELRKFVKGETVWGGLRPISSSEREHADREIGEISHEIILRVGKISPKPGDQIRYKGRIFDLKPARNIREQNRMFVIPATELVDQTAS